MRSAILPLGQIPFVHSATGYVEPGPFSHAYLTGPLGLFAEIPHRLK